MENTIAVEPTFFRQRLNYTLANEDTGLEINVLPLDLNKVVSVCGSGSRCLPLLSKHPKNLTLVDLSDDQLALAELRIELVRRFNHELFLRFLGYPVGLTSRPMLSSERKSLFKELNLSNTSRLRLNHYFEKHAFESILYQGKWEQSFAKLSFIAQTILGQKNIIDFFEYGKPLPEKRWAAVLAIVGHSKVFNALMYQGDFPKKNLPISYFSFYQNAFKRLFDHGSPQKNFFLQLCLLGRLKYNQGLPVEAQESVFYQAKEALRQCDVQFKQASISQLLKHDRNVDAVSMSDVPSYFKKPLEQTFMQDMASALNPGALVINRYYLRVPENIQLAGYLDVTQNYTRQIQQELTQMYQIQILERLP